MTGTSRIALSLQRKQGIKALIRWFTSGHELGQALADRYFVFLEQNGVRNTIDSAGKTQQEIETRWTSEGDVNALLSYLKTYRLTPENCHPDVAIRSLLRAFLFCKGTLDGPLTTLLRPPADLLIKSDPSSLPLLLNIPWELADGIPTLGTTGALAGTIAALPIARIVPLVTSKVDLERERLRVAYCISEPSDGGSIDAKRFDDSFHMILSHRSGMLDSIGIGAPSFCPRLVELKAELSNQRPHVFVIACHGRTTKGKPELRLDQWIPVAEIAEALSAYRKTFLVMLIACDLTFLEDGATAHSGAYTFLEAGIPAVVAMQSKVRADLAATFLGTSLDFLFSGPSLAMAVAEGRKSMAPSQKAVDAMVDWSFPALFLSQDGLEKTDVLSDYFQFRPALEALVRSIPRKEPFFPRNEVQKAISALLDPPASGLKAIAGGWGMGKTTLVREVCRSAIGNAIRTGNTAFRPILYVDLSRSRPITSAAELTALLRDRVEEVKPSLTGSALIDLKLPPARVADGSGLGEFPIRQVTESLDRANFVLVLDSFGNSSPPLWAEFLALCTTLLHSVVILVTEGPPKTVALAQGNIVTVQPLTREETREYVRGFQPERVASADSWFFETAGVPALLDNLLQGTGTHLVTNTISQLSGPDQDLLFKLAHLPNGVNAALAWDFIPGWPNADIPSLVRKGLLLAESRFGLAQEWLTVPGILARSMHSAFADQTQSAAYELAESFDSRISEGDPEQELLELTSRPGGIQFIHDLQSVLIEIHSVKCMEQARALSVLLHERLFQRGRWHDAYQLDKRVLETLPVDQTEASEWIRLAKSQHLLGLAAEAWQSLECAAKRCLTKLEEADVIVQEIALRKDAGEIVDTADVIKRYDDALALLDKATDAEEELVRSRRATIWYNRGIILGHWSSDPAKALSDFEAAQVEYTNLGNKNMIAMCEVEWVEVQFSAEKSAANWELMFDRLVHADKLLAEVDAAGDRAFCYYQFARYYRRKPFADLKEFQDNAIKARDAYQRSSEMAKLAGDPRQEAIAVAHVIEVSWQDLCDIKAEDVILRLEPLLGILRTFRGDAWSSRVARDMVAILADAQTKAQKLDNALASLKAAWETAVGQPLHPEHGTDAFRAARILELYVTELVRRGNGFEADLVTGGAKHFVEQWLGRSIDPVKRGEWLPDLREFGKAAGGYHGKPTRK